ncbi:MAG TPA: LysR family transcriptional regulator [Stellaceae bacterium]|nr:LysR family transcriptional regulator [Stellaceae bacterium]
MDRFTTLAVFVKVVDSRNFAAAARHFGLSPAMVSKHVRALEERLGARLLNRTTRRLSLTEVGRGYYERARQILADLEDADRAASDLHAAPRGTLKLNAPFSFGTRHVGPAIAAYLSAYPEVTVETGLSDRYVDLLAEGVDLALRIGRLADSSLIARRLAPIRFVACASPDYLARHDAPRRPHDLAAHGCLLYTYAANAEEWHFVGPGGEDEVVRVSGRLLANNGDILIAAALGGIGIALLPTFMAGEHVQAGRLARLLPGYAPPEAALYAVYPPGRHLSAKLRSFVDFLVARFGEEPEWDRWCREAAGSLSGN